MLLPGPVPDQIKPLLEEYLLLMEKKLPDFLSGFYLHGSLALGAFNEHLSDIDFIAVTTRNWAESEVVYLKEIHRAIQTNYPRWPLQGIYLQSKHLALSENVTPSYLNYHDSQLRSSTKLSLNEVDWWLLKNRGITLKGPEANSLDFQVDWKILVAKMKYNLNTYWASFTSKPNRMAWLFTDYGIQWSVLGVLRQYYTFKENNITSKTGAGEYALTHLPPKWHRLIQEAINLREQSKNSLYKSKAGRAFEALRFLKYIIRLCNSIV